MPAIRRTQNAIEFQGGPLGERAALAMLVAFVGVFTLPLLYGGMTVLQENIVMGVAAAVCLLGFVLTASRLTVRVDGTRQEVRWFVGSFLPIRRARNFSHLCQERLETGLIRLSLVLKSGTAIPLTVSRDGLHVHRLASEVATLLALPVEKSERDSWAASPAPQPVSGSSAPVPQPFFAASAGEEPERLGDLEGDPALEVSPDSDGVVLRVTVDRPRPHHPGRNLGTGLGIIGLSLVLGIALALRPADTTLLPLLGVSAALVLSFGLLLRKVMERPAPLSVRVDLNELLVATSVGRILRLPLDAIEGMEVLTVEGRPRLVLRDRAGVYAVDEGTAEQLRLLERAIKAALRELPGGLKLGAAF